jgi:hypothetical protein
MAPLKPGDRLRSRVCTTEVIIVKAPKGKAVISCGGQPMAAAGEQVGPSAALAAMTGPGTLIGKRYADEEHGLELLCVKGGGGELTVNGHAIRLREARPLPASD